jgi:hypothetical protein
MNKEETEAIRKDYAERAEGPGKFEGESIYSPYFYDAIMDGGIGEEFYFGEGEPVYTLTELTEDDKAIFPELSGDYGVCLWESEQGFFNCVVISTKADYLVEKANLEFQQAEEEEPEL